MAELPGEADPILDNEDIFEGVVMADERCHERGYEEGFKKGKELGQAQGFEMGKAKGQQVGDEIGFYLGFAVTWKAFMEHRVDEDPSAKRCLKALEGLVAAMDKLPTDEPNSVKYWDTVQKIRSKFKQVGSLLNITVNYRPQTRQKGLSF
ncbi:protein LTO1 homolog [Diadema antillarum]|uniref:protein LTO1 homolog n=1 Tax=Diadema antillarum TaxID=105358 RepID=UPI003A8BC87A